MVCRSSGGKDRDVNWWEALWCAGLYGGKYRDANWWEDLWCAGLVGGRIEMPFGGRLYGVQV